MSRRKSEYHFQPDITYLIGEVKSGAPNYRNPELIGNPRSVYGEVLLRHGCTTPRELAEKNPLALREKRLYAIIERQEDGAQRTITVITPLPAPAGTAPHSGLADAVAPVPMFDDRANKYLPTPRERIEALEEHNRMLHSQLSAANQNVQAVLMQNQQLIEKINDALDSRATETAAKVEAVMALKNQVELSALKESLSQELDKRVEREVKRSSQQGLSGLLEHPAAVPILQSAIGLLIGKFFGPGPDAMPPGGFPPGGFPPGSIPPEAFPPGAYPQGAGSPGGMPPGAFYAQANHTTMPDDIPMIHINET